MVSVFDIFMDLIHCPIIFYLSPINPTQVIPPLGKRVSPASLVQPNMLNINSCLSPINPTQVIPPLGKRVSPASLVQPNMLNINSCLCS